MRNFVGSRRSALWVLSLPLFSAVSLGAACGSGGDTAGAGAGGQAGGTGSSSSSGAGGSSSGLGGGGVGGVIDHGPAVSLTVDPPQASIECLNGATASQTFKATAHFKDGTTGATAAGWSANGLAIGTIDGGGVFTATGALGGTVTVTATAGGLTATATLAVKVHLTQNPATADAPTQASLKQASAPDASIAWAYPYDKTVFPRGLGQAPLMWIGGAVDDVYYVHLTSATFELETFVTQLPSRYDFDQAVWDQFTGSTSGAAELKVGRFAAGATTLVVDHHWTIAPASMRGTIYYWAINTGRVMRIKPGAAAPDDFLGPAVACPSCHTVSANGAHLVMNEGNWPSETSIDYDLVTNQNAFSGLFNGGGASQWALAGVSADGKVVVQNFAPLRGPIGVANGAFDAVSGALLPNSGLDGVGLWMPSFSPDDKLLSYVDSSSKDLRAFDWNEGAESATNDRLIMAAGGDPALDVVSFPTASPDHAWLAYQRSSALGSLGNPADLYVASVGQPGTEVALDNLNGPTYPFAAGDRDRHLNYEPTFAPVAAGGFFWVVFHSRRTFGNALTGAAYNGEGSGTKQLWVAAIDQAPVPGQDPSHPAFHLPGQDLGTLNMRGYWALDPCKGDGQGCQTGTECCGGYCDASGDSGQPVCKSTSNGCSAGGDHCTTSADCCGAKAGTTCINSVCSEAPPK